MCVGIDTLTTTGSSGIKRFQVENLCDNGIYEEDGRDKVKKNLMN